MGKRFAAEFQTQCRRSPERADDWIDRSISYMRKAPEPIPVRAPFGWWQDSLSITAFEQVVGSCLEILGTEYLKAEGVGEPVR